MLLRSIMTLSCINIGLSVYAGFFIPPEYHETFALPIKDYFLISAVSFAACLYALASKNVDKK